MQNLGGVFGTASLASLKLAGCERVVFPPGAPRAAAAPRDAHPAWQMEHPHSSTGHPKAHPNSSRAGSTEVRGKGLLGGAFIGMEPEDEADGPDLLAGSSCLFN